MGREGVKIQTYGPKKGTSVLGAPVYWYFAEALGTDGRYHSTSVESSPTQHVDLQESFRNSAATALKHLMMERSVWQETWDDLTVEGVRDALIDNEDVGDWELHEGSFDPNAWGDLGPVEHVASVGGSEGAGEVMYYVVKCGSRYFRKEGYYASWDGSRWDGRFREVHPVEKTITVWDDK